MKKIAVAVFVLLCSVTARAEVKLNDILAKMEEADKKTECVSFGFRQDIVYNLTNEKQSNSGEVAFLKPNSLYMKQKNPLEQTIVSNGKKVWIYTPAYKQTLVDSWKKWASNSMVPVSMLNFGESWKDLKQKYTFTYVGEEDGEYVLLLNPKKKDQWQLKFWVSRENYLPVRVSLIGDNFVINTYTDHYEVNPKIDKKIFAFTVPQGVEVLELP